VFRRDFLHLAPWFKRACICTLVLELVSLGLGAYWGIEYRLSGACLPVGWLPILLIALRRPEKPASSDIVVMFTSFPALFAATAIFDHWYFLRH